LPLRQRHHQHQQSKRQPPLPPANSGNCPIQFSDQFAQILQQSLARQYESTAACIGVPGLVLAPTPTSSTDEDDDGGNDGSAPKEQQGSGGTSAAESSVDDGTGGFVWGAGASLAALLWRHRREELRGRSVLELGAGTAVVSIVAAAAGARLVVATDLPSRLMAVERNVELNQRPGGALCAPEEASEEGAAERAAAGAGAGQAEAAAAAPPPAVPSPGVVRVAALDWAEGAQGVERVVNEHLGGGTGSSFDWVLGADLTYAAAAMVPLARTVRAAITAGAGTRAAGAAGAGAAAGGGGTGAGRQEDGASAQSPQTETTVLLAHRPRSPLVDAAMRSAFAAEGLGLEEDREGTARLCDCGGGEMEGEGDGEPMVLFRVRLRR
jgi:predicted nicotinamide N-methyase